jgi:hypothetical protein
MLRLPVSDLINAAPLKAYLFPHDHKKLYQLILIKLPKEITVLFPQKTLQNTDDFLFLHTLYPPGAIYPQGAGSARRNSRIADAILPASYFSGFSAE